MGELLISLTVLVVTVVAGKNLFLDFLSFWRGGPFQYEEWPLFSCIFVIFFNFGWGLTSSIVVSFFVGPTTSSLDLGRLEVLLILPLVVMLEESMFRWLPLICAWFIKKNFKKDLYLLFGYISSILFGALHITNFVAPRWYYFLLTLPQIQAAFAFYWLARKYKFGFLYAACTHLAFNLLLIVPLILWGK